MSEWKEVRLGDVCTELSDGLHKAPLFVEGGDYIFVNAKNLCNGSIVDNDPTKKTTYEEYLKYSKPLNENTILFSIDGTIGNIARYKGEKCVLGKGACYINPNPFLADSSYIYYQLQSPHFNSYLNCMSTGSTIKHISLKTMRNYEFTLPPLSEQCRISSILSSFDDKIAVNRRICENLEAQAQALFKHWFIDFAPFKDGKFVESELGMIPLSEICDQITDGVHNSVKDEPNSNYMLLSCKNIVGGVLSKNNYRSISKSTFESLRLRTKLAKGDVLLSSVGTIGEIAIVEEDPIYYEFQRSVAIVKPKKKIGTYFLYNALLASKARLQHAAHGAVQQCLFIGDLKKFEVIYCDTEKASRYNETVKPLFEEIAKLHQESSRLANLRDTLLPKLMSGQIKV